MRKRKPLTAIIALPVAALILTATPANADTMTAPTIDDPVAAIYEWFPRHGIDPAAGVCIARHESGLNRTNDSRRYFGLFQHLKGSWAGRVAAYNRVNDLKTPNADPHDPTTQALVTAWMVKNDGSWKQWGTARACGLRVSRSRGRR